MRVKKDQKMFINNNFIFQTNLYKIIFNILHKEAGMKIY